MGKVGIVLIPWSEEALDRLYHRRLAFDAARGIDRIAPTHLKDRLPDEIALISRKITSGTYRFAPYAQVLRNRGASKLPREICIPTARDRLVLLQLKENLHAAFPKNVPEALPNSMVRSALHALREADCETQMCLRLDIKNFYGSIRHDRLLSIVETALSAEDTVLVEKAIRNPSVPYGSRRSHAPRSRKDRGVPQGLAISNVLADLYLEDLDTKVQETSTAYFRFVDDLLVITAADSYQAVYDLVREELGERGLHVHALEPRSSKGGLFRLDERIEFLGYVFEGEKIGVRDISVDRFIANVAGRVTRHGTDLPRLLRLRSWMTRELAIHILIEELNERITGAISEARRYGWMFYFSALTNESLLFEIDAAITSLVMRLPEFRKQRPPALKRLARAYHEVKHRPDSAYIHSYDRIETTKQRLDFLAQRGQIGPDDLMNKDQVNDLFERYRRQQLRELDADLAFVS